MEEIDDEGIGSLPKLEAKLKEAEALGVPPTILRSAQETFEKNQENAVKVSNNVHNMRYIWLLKLMFIVIPCWNVPVSTTLTRVFMIRLF